MLNAEYDYDTDIRVKSQESWEEGMQQGIAWQKAQSEKEFNKLLSEQNAMWSEKFSEQSALIAQLQAQLNSLRANKQS